MVQRGGTVYPDKRSHQRQLQRAQRGYDAPPRLLARQIARQRRNRHAGERDGHGQNRAGLRGAEAQIAQFGHEGGGNPGVGRGGGGQKQQPAQAAPGQPPEAEHAGKQRAKPGGGRRIGLRLAVKPHLQQQNVKQQHQPHGGLPAQAAEHQQHQRAAHHLSGAGGNGLNHAAEAALAVGQQNAAQAEHGAAVERAAGAQQQAGGGQRREAVQRVDGEQHQQGKADAAERHQHPAAKASATADAVALDQGGKQDFAALHAAD